MECPHTAQRRYVYGGGRGDAFDCPCGKRFYLVDLPHRTVLPPEAFGQAGGLRRREVPRSSNGLTTSDTKGTLHTMGNHHSQPPLWPPLWQRVIAGLLLFAVITFLLWAFGSMFVVAPVATGVTLLVLVGAVSLAAKYGPSL